jgi:hypothetical protein
MKYLFYLIVLLSLSSCSKNEQVINSPPVRASLDIVYLNKQGQNLLDESTPDQYSPDKMKLYFIERGIKTQVNNQMSDRPSGISFIKELPIRISVLANVGYADDVISESSYEKIGQSTALLQIDDNLIDTIKTEWESGRSGHMIMKAWHNGKLVYDVRAGVNGLVGLEGYVVTK